MSAALATASIALPPPVLTAQSRQGSATSREMISWARASAQSGVQARRAPPPPLARRRRPRRPIEMAMLAAGQVGFLGAAVAGVAVMVG